MDDRTIAAIRALAAELTAERAPRWDDDYERGHATGIGDAGRSLQALLDQDGTGQAPRTEEQYGIQLDDGRVIGTWRMASAAKGAASRSGYTGEIVTRAAAYTPWVKVTA